MFYLTIDGVEPLKAIEQLIEQQLGFLVQRADERVPLVEPQQHVHAPLQLRVPHVKGRHAAKWKQSQELKAAVDHSARASGLKRD